MGACIGEAILGKKIGKKVMLLGALAQSIPDIDFITATWMDIPSGLLAHRGFSHSILLGFMLVFSLAVISGYWRKKNDVSLELWLLFFGIEIFTHLFIDAFNAYGIGLFEPFNHSRISFNTIFVADPFFSIWLIISFTALILLKPFDRRRKFWTKWGLILTCLYFFYCTINKSKIDHEIKIIFQKQGIAYKNYFTTPTPLNNWLWYAVVSTDSGYLVGYRSVFDKTLKMQFSYFPRNDSLLGSAPNPGKLNRLLRFSKGYYTIEKRKDTLVFNDLRFGQVVGWYDPKERFVFHYFLTGGNNKFVVQKRRFARWNCVTTKALLKRIVGE